MMTSQSNLVFFEGPSRRAYWSDQWQRDSARDLLIQCKRTFLFASGIAIFIVKSLARGTMDTCIFHSVLYSTTGMTSLFAGIKLSTDIALYLQDRGRDWILLQIQRDGRDLVLAIGS